MANKKSWREKVNEVKEKIHTITPEWESRLGKGEILIPSAKDIESLIRMTKTGELLTNDIIRARLARDKKVRVTAAIPTGVYLKYIALAAEEEKAASSQEITPYWRVLRPDGSINIKFPQPVEQLIELLESEGHNVSPGKGKKPPRVLEFEKNLNHLE